MLFNEYEYELLPILPHPEAYLANEITNLRSPNYTYYDENCAVHKALLNEIKERKWKARFEYYSYNQRLLHINHHNSKFKFILFIFKFKFHNYNWLNLKWNTYLCIKSWSFWKTSSNVLKISGSIWRKMVSQLCIYYHIFDYSWIPLAFSARNSYTIPGSNLQRWKEDVETKGCASKNRALMEWIVGQGMLSKSNCEFGWLERLSAWSMGQRPETSRAWLLLESDVCLIPRRDR